MSTKQSLRQFYNEKKILTELQELFQGFEGLDEGVPELVISYCLQWFDSYFKNECTEEDFIAEINKLEKSQCEEKLIKFISAKITEFKAKLSSEIDISSTPSSSSAGSKLLPSIQDRIKPKSQQQNTDSSISTPTKQPVKKQVKILQKDEAKIQKAVEAVSKHTTNPSSLDGDDESLLKELENKKKQRCKYFPNCKNGDTCPFVHPTEPCKFFPRCQYGSQCLNKHPDCKFGKSCSRMDCFYEHPYPKKQTMNPLLQLFMNPMMGGVKRLTPTKPYGGKRHFNSANKDGDTKTPAKEQEIQDNISA